MRPSAVKQRSGQVSPLKLKPWPSAPVSVAIFPVTKRTKISPPHRIIRGRCVWLAMVAITASIACSSTVMSRDEAKLRRTLHSLQSQHAPIDKVDAALQQDGIDGLRQCGVSANDTGCNLSQEPQPVYTGNSTRDYQGIPTGPCTIHVIVRVDDQDRIMSSKVEHFCNTF
jgi:hypothetical protein